MHGIHAPKIKLIWECINKVEPGFKCTKNHRKCSNNQPKIPLKKHFIVKMSLKNKFNKY